MPSESCLTPHGPMDWGTRQASLSRQEYWRGLPCPPPGNLPNPGIEPRSPVLLVDSLPPEPPMALSLKKKKRKGTSRNFTDHFNIIKLTVTLPVFTLMTVSMKLKLLFWELVLIFMTAFWSIGSFFFFLIIHMAME